MFNRRTFLSGTAATIAAAHCAKLTPNCFGQSRLEEIPATGEFVEKLKPFDDLMLNILKEQEVPGASLAVAKNGALLYNRGFGWSDRGAQTTVQPDSIFRIASVSKPITAMAILKLSEQKKLTLDEPVLPRLKALFPSMPQIRDSRWEKITIRHCLQHRGGWDRDKSFDPIGRIREIAKTLGSQTPVSPRQIIEYMFTIDLDFDPGQRAAYSNFGYIILGRLIEEASDMSYSDFVQRELLQPLNCSRTQLGRACRADRLNGEVTYYDREKRRRPSLYPADRGADVDLPYGAENFEAYEAHGGWTSTTADLVRFASILLPKTTKRLLAPASIASIKKRPEGGAGYNDDGKPRDHFIGLGWFVRPMNSTTSKMKEIAGRKTLYGPAANLWHAGFIAGTEALLVQRHDHVSWAVVFNTQSTPSGKSLIGVIDPLLHQAAAASGIVG